MLERKRPKTVLILETLNGVTWMTKTTRNTDGQVNLRKCGVAVNYEEAFYWYKRQLQLETLVARLVL